MDVLWKFFMNLCYKNDENVDLTVFDLYMWKTSTNEHRRVDVWPAQWEQNSDQLIACFSGQCIGAVRGNTGGVGKRITTGHRRRKRGTERIKDCVCGQAHCKTGINLVYRRKPPEWLCLEIKKKIIETFINLCFTSSLCIVLVGSENAIELDFSFPSLCLVFSFFFYCDKY